MFSCSFPTSPVTFILKFLWAHTGRQVTKLKFKDLCKTALLRGLNREAHNSGPALYSCPLPSIEPLVIIW